MNTIEEKIEKVVDSILEDYGRGRIIDKIDLFRRPDRDVIIDIIKKLRRIVFPGYYRDKNYRIYNAKHNISMLVEDVMFNLNRQIALGLENRGMTEEQAQEEAQRLCLEFIAQIPKVRSQVHLELCVRDLWIICPVG